MNKSLSIFAAALTSATVAGGAAADADRGFYVGFGLGQAEFFTESDVCRSIESRALNAIEQEFGEQADTDEVFAQIRAGTDCRADTSDRAWQLFGGYRFNPFFALEAALFDPGRVSVDIESDVDQPEGSVDANAAVDVDLRGLVASGLVSVPVTRRASVFGRLGVLAWEGDLTARASGEASAGGVTNSAAATFRTSDEGLDVTYGAGGRFRLTDRVAVRAEWTRYEVADLESIMASIEFLFSGGGK